MSKVRERVLKMVRDDLTLNEIIEKSGASEWTVRSNLAKHAPSWYTEAKELRKEAVRREREELCTECRQLYREGRTIREIAGIIGRTERVTYRILDRCYPERERRRVASGVK